VFRCKYGQIIILFLIQVVLARVNRGVYIRVGTEETVLTERPLGGWVLGGVISPAKIQVSSFTGKTERGCLYPSRNGGNGADPFGPPGVSWGGGHFLLFLCTKKWCTKILI
jgi:hypothetical protein